MAIEIPSKSIYKIDNKKILDNVYNSIECSYNEIDYSSDIVLNTNVLSMEKNQNDNWVNIFNRNASDTFIVNEAYRFTVDTHYYLRRNGYIIINSSNNIKTRWDDLSLQIDGDFMFGTSRYTNSAVSKEIMGEYDDINAFIAALPSTNRNGDYYGIKKISDTTLWLYYDVPQKYASSSDSANYVLLYITYRFELRTNVLGTTQVAIKGDVSPVLSVPTNELINSATKTSATSLPANQNIIEYIEDGIKFVYDKGLETATIRCSINNYYEYQGETKLKSIDDDNIDMLFSIGDLVVPMKNTPQGDVPLSMRNGLAKIFRVCAVNIINNGVVWQELTLIEARSRVIWTGSVVLNVAKSADTGSNIAYTDITNLPFAVQNNYKFRVYIQRASILYPTKTVIDTDSGAYIFTESRTIIGTTYKSIYTVSPPTYLSNNSVRITSTTTQYSVLAPPVERHIYRIEAYY